MLQYNLVQSPTNSPYVYAHERPINVSAKATSGKSTGKRWARPCAVPQHALPTRLPRGRLGAAGRATRLGRACARVHRPHVAAVGRALRKAAAAALVTLVAAHHLPWELENMLRQCAGRIGQWAGSSAWTGA